ncbi:MAG TPA: competence protein, partial [Aequorivita sp.]|nr:competence protein [Aequorivita sp.]
SRQTLVGYQNSSQFIVLKSDSTINSSEAHPIKSFKVAMNTKFYSEERLPRLFRYNNKNILILDSLGIFPKHKNINTLLLTNSTKVNLDRLIDSLRPKQIIADGSNYYSYVNRWEKTCKLKKLPFHHTAKQGAFPIE